MMRFPLALNAIVENVIIVSLMAEYVIRPFKHQRWQ